MRDAEMAERDPVVPGERPISDQRRGHGEEKARGRDRRERAPDLRPDMLTAKFLVEQPKRDGDGEQADRGPDEIQNSFHDAPDGGRAATTLSACRAKGAEFSGAARKAHIRA